MLKAKNKGSAILTILVMVISLIVPILLNPFVTEAAGETVYIPDEGLRSALAQYVNINENGYVLKSDLAELEEFNSYPYKIKDLTGLEYAVNLETLSIRYDNISDISPLSTLTKLSGIELDCNNISDISPLSTLTNLSYINLINNNISDISPLSTLTNLNYIYLSNNNISDISPLAGITVDVYELYLDNNNISDISTLSTHTNHGYIDLRNNNISDISRLSVLTELYYLDLANNNISDISSLAGLSVWAINLNDNNISDISPLSTFNCSEYLDLRNNNISDISSLSALRGLYSLDLDNNNISDISPLSRIGVEYLSLNNNNISDISPLLNGIDINNLEDDFSFGCCGNIYLKSNPIDTSKNSYQLKIIKFLQDYGIYFDYDKNYSSNIVTGDLDGDVEVTTADLIHLAKSLCNRVELTAEQKVCADCNSNGRVNSDDLLIMIKFLTGAVKSLPI